jgi:hypothetical protein
VHGEYDISLGECICSPLFSGRRCDLASVGVTSGSLVQQIANKSFSLDSYQFRRNQTGDYQDLIVGLASQLWSEINVAQLFLHDFDYAHMLANQSNLSASIHRLNVYAHHDVAHFEANFLAYTTVIDSLVDILLADTSSIACEALGYVDYWIQVNNLTSELVVGNSSNNNVSTTTTPPTTVIVDNNEVDLGRWLGSESSSASTKPAPRTASALLCESIEARSVRYVNATSLVLEQFYASYLNATTAAANYTLTLQCYANRLANLTANVWDSVVSYGFWHSTLGLASLEEEYVYYNVLNSNLKREINDRKESVETVLFQAKPNPCAID